MSGERLCPQNGYTLVELVTVLVIIGFLSAAAAPRFFSTDEFATRGYADDLSSALRYAQKLAIGSGCDIRFASDATGYAVWRWIGGSNCSDHNGTLVQVTRPGGDAFAANVPAQVSADALDIFFDPIGRPRLTSNSALLTANQTLAVGPHTVTLEAETGLVQ